MLDRLHVAKAGIIAAALAVGGCSLPFSAPSGPVGPRSCPALVHLKGASPEARPAPPGTTLRGLLAWREAMTAYAAALERQASAREAQIDKHNRGL